MQMVVRTAMEVVGLGVVGTNNASSGTETLAASKRRPSGRADRANGRPITIISGGVKTAMGTATMPSAVRSAARMQLPNAAVRELLISFAGVGGRWMSEAKQTRRKEMTDYVTLILASVFRN